MHIYLASRYSRHPEMCEVADALEESGHVVTSRWIRGSHSLDESIERGQDDEVRAQFAIEDFEDLTKSDCVVSFTETPQSAKEKARPSKGGRHVEFGIGLAFNKRMIIVGPQEHIFHWLPNVEIYPDVEVLLEALDEGEDLNG